MVQGRGLNHHLNLIWNTVDHDVSANYDDLKKDGNKAWLIRWRDCNCSHERIEEVLEKRVWECTKELEQAKEGEKDKKKLEKINIGLKILLGITRQSIQGVSGKRLLLEIATLTPDIILRPSGKDIARYDELSNKIAIKYPGLKILKGLMKSLFGLVLCFISGNKVQKLFNAGLSTAKSGFFSGDRTIISKAMHKIPADTAVAPRIRPSDP